MSKELEPMPIGLKAAKAAEIRVDKGEIIISPSNELTVNVSQGTSFNIKTLVKTNINDFNGDAITKLNPGEQAIIKYNPPMLEDKTEDEE